MDEPISPKLADAFFEAVRGYVRWGFIRPEPSVTDHQGELIPISAVCRRVDKFTDPSLLEILDPQRFTRGVPVRPGELDAVMVRRLKSDLRHWWLANCALRWQ